MNQDQAFKILKSGENTFITGSAGTGKTFLLNRFITYLKKKKVKFGVTASTGIAATHLDGRTIHSWTGMGIKAMMKDGEIERTLKRPKLKKRIKDTRVLIIDEISMLDSERFYLVDRICKIARNSVDPFGGIQLIVCGDFFQLPPVGSNALLDFAYNSVTWKNSITSICYLTEQFRQNDDKFISILDKIRANEAGEKELGLLNERLNKEVSGTLRPTKIYALNYEVDLINEQELTKIPGEVKSHQMTNYGPIKLVEALKKNCLAPEELNLKVGAIVMFVRNNFEEGFVNGTIGKVVGFSDDDFPIIETKNRKTIVALPVDWAIEENDKVIARITQIPLRLAWAITIHKSQGMSLDIAEIDLSRSFELGMGYVALSRVRSLDGIRLIGINDKALQVNPEVVEKDKEFRLVSAKLEKNIKGS